MTRIGRRAEEVRELREREALASPVQEPPREPDGVDHGGGDAPAGEPLDGVVEEAHVEAGVVCGERCITGEREEATNGELLTRRAPQLGVAQAGQPGDRRWQRDPGVDQRLERLGDLERPHANRADLAHAVARGREPGRLEVEDDELGVLDERVGLRAVREARRERRATSGGRHRRRRRRGGSGRGSPARARARTARVPPPPTRPRPGARGSARRAGRRHRTTAASRSTVVERMFVFKSGSADVSTRGRRGRGFRDRRDRKAAQADFRSAG